MMAEEVEALCGPKYARDHESDCRRAGSERGHAFINGTKEEITRPRVRNANGEVPLSTYNIAKDRNLIFDQVVEAIAAGMPVRGVEDCHGGGRQAHPGQRHVGAEKRRIHRKAAHPKS